MTREQSEILEKIKSDKTKQKALDYLIKSFPELNEDYILCEVANYEIDGLDYKNQVVHRYIAYVDAVKELEKENAELKKRNSELAGQKASLERWFGEAKKIIREYLEWADWKGSNCPSFADICKKAEAFLNKE